jgi:hypothetical protein
MKYVDEVCAWLILSGGLLAVVLTEFFHLQGILDTALVWILVSMPNLVRIGNATFVRRLKISSVGANFSVLLLEAVRWKMSHWPLSFAIGALVLIEGVFSIKGKSGDAHEIQLRTRQSAS